MNTLNLQRENSLRQMAIYINSEISHQEDISDYPCHLFVLIKHNKISLVQ